MFRKKQKNKPVDGVTFSRKAWEQLSLQAPTELALYGKFHRGHLAVTLSNDSGEVLEPGENGAIAFCFKLLDLNGEVLPHEAIRTPLKQAVPAGGKHEQTVSVILPSAQLQDTAAIRVGLLHEDMYWGETLNAQHPCTVQISDGGALDTTEAQMAAAGQIWKRGKSNGMRWPYGSMMSSESHKLLYIPVAKCACTTLKSMMIKLAGIDRPDIARELGVHFVTDRFNTGVQLKDKPIELAREILASDQYFKFSVIRDPFERLVSAYLEKFVYHRSAERNLLHTREVISKVQGSADIDLQAGISFDQFVEYIFDQDPYDLDPHWRPQYLYFLGVKHISRIFRLENILELEKALQQQLGSEIKLSHANATGKSDALLAQASTLTASEFDKLESIDPDSFLTSRHAEAIRQYYREDFEFYQSAV